MDAAITPASAVVVHEMATDLMPPVLPAAALLDPVESGTSAQLERHRRV